MVLLCLFLASWKKQTPFLLFVNLGKMHVVQLPFPKNRQNDPLNH